MQLRSGKRKLDAYQPTFDPNLDIATVVFSHVQCVGTRVRLAQVSKLWRDASKLAAGYPRRFDFTDSEAILRADSLGRRYSFLIDNDEALSLPREQVFELLKSFWEVGRSTICTPLFSTGVPVALCRCHRECKDAKMGAGERHALASDE